MRLKKKLLASRYNTNFILLNVGALQRLQLKLEKPLIIAICGHHTDEVIVGGVIEALFGRSVSPYHEACKTYQKWHDVNKDKIPEHWTYDDTNPPLSFKPDHPLFKKCLADLVALQERLTKDDAKCSLPRGDYCELWNFVQVILESPLSEIIFNVKSFFSSFLGFSLISSVNLLSHLTVESIGCSSVEM